MHFSDSRLLPFMPDETLPSYVSRMACDIGLSPAVFAYAPGTPIHRINRGSVDALEKVASVFRLPMDKVYGTRHGW